MKMRKKIAALLAAAMIASVMPMTVFAASSNRVDNVMTVEKDSTIDAKNTPILKVEMKDRLTKNLSFYLELEGAEWAPIYNGTVTGYAEVNPAGGFVYNQSTTESGIQLALDHVTGISNVKDVVTADSKESDALTEALRSAERKARVAKDGIGVTDVDFTSDTKAIEFDMVFGVRTVTFEAYRENSKVMAIRTLPTSTHQLEAGDEFVFPLMTKVTDSEAIVKVRKHDTEVSNSEHLFSVSDAAKAKVVVGDVPGFYRTTEIAPITIEELYANSIASVTESKRWFTLELRDTDFTFEVDSDAKIVGERAYRNYEAGLTYTLSNDKTRLGIQIKDVDKDNNGLDITNDVARERGNFILKGVKVVADRDARDGEVKATIESKELLSKDIITIAKRGDYKTKLSVADDWKYEVVAGTEKEVTFKLSEELANSLTGTRPVTFTFDQGVTIKTDKADTSSVWTDWKADNILWGDLDRDVEAEVRQLLADIDDHTKAADKVDNQIRLYTLLNLYTTKAPAKPGKVALTADVKGFEIVGNDNVDADLDKGKWSLKADKPLAKRVHIADNKKSFTVDNFNLVQDKVGAYTFTMPLNIPADVTGDIKVAVAGRGVTEEEITILKAEAPVTVETTGIDIKVGLKEIETEGKVVIKETAKERLRQGKDIVLRIADIDNGLKIKSFDYKVTEGDLLLEDKNGTWKDGDKAIGVKRSSTEASTIEITNIVMFTDRTVPEGKYDLLVGGNAISDHARTVTQDKDTVLDPVATIKNFVNITTKNTEDIAGAGNKAEVSFTVGSADYLINGKTATMDAPAYIKDGNTMVSFRYVATALGVNEDQVAWDGPNQTATIIADKVVQVKLGSKSMNVNGVSIPMTASAELVNDRTFVPMGAIARALGVEVEWDNDTKTATFNPAK